MIVSRFKVDVSNCDREPIHIPGSVQSWGFLVIAGTTTSVITYVSGNIVDFIDITAGSVLGKPLHYFEKLLSAGKKANPLGAFIESAKRKSEPEVYPVEFDNKYFELIIHLHNQYIYLEFEPKARSAEADIHSQIGRHVSSILSAHQLNHMLNRSASVIKELIGYDRVMIYQFVENHHGRVVAEAKNSDLEPFLDLHYPASDIPAQARKLYKLNKIRIIADVHSPVSAIASLTDVPVDLSHSVLRAVSPMHIQYLKNMGVASSFSISLLSRGELWGLIACHNYTPKFINYRVRESAGLLGQIISSSIEFKEEEIYNEQQSRHKAVLETIISRLRAGDDIKSAVFSSDVSFKDIVKASGAYMKYEGESIQDGLIPSIEQIDALIEWLSENNNETIFHTSKLEGLVPEAANYVHVASGVLVCTISRELKEYIIWFRPEYPQSITWAGNPDKPVELTESGDIHISPRTSFQSFKQLLKNTSENWKEYEKTVALQFKEELLFIINKKASEIRILNERLKDAYEELETFSTTISHDLKTPLTVIKSYAQLLERNKTLDDAGKNFAARISFSIGKMNLLIAEVLEYSKMGRVEIDFKPVDMKNLLNTIQQELNVAFDLPDPELIIKSTPTISGDQTMLYQVFLNLINNAVKYSRLSSPPLVTVEGTEDEYGILYKIQDNGIGIDPKHHGRVFELFKRVNVTEDFEGTGVGLAIVKRIVEKHKASIWIESTLGKGSIFWLRFRKDTDNQVLFS